MSATERLEGLQAALVAEGVKDVKFFFANECLGGPTQAAEGAAIVLEAYLKGRCVDATKYIKPPA